MIFLFPQVKNVTILAERAETSPARVTLFNNVSSCSTLTGFVAFIDGFSVLQFCENLGAFLRKELMEKKKGKYFFLAKVRFYG